MPRIERRNQLRTLPPSWRATAVCLGASAEERFGLIEPLDAADAATWLWLEGDDEETLALWELLIRAMMAHERGVAMERLVGRRPPWEERFVGTTWLVSTAEVEGVATASCVCLPGAEVEGAWSWHAVGPWGGTWPALRMLTDGLVELGARVFAERDAAMEFASTGPSVAAVGTLAAQYEGGATLLEPLRILPVAPPTPLPAQEPPRSMRPAAGHGAPRVSSPAGAGV